VALYLDEQGRSVVTHSMVKTFRRCPQQAHYKYVRRLKPRLTSQPLKRGVWVHRLLQVHMDGDDWKAEHKRLSQQFATLLDEERDFYGDLPREIYTIMRGYFWHYKEHDWKVLDTEFVLECELPNGSMFRCKIDALVEDQYGLWIVDHKSHKRVPGLDYRILDAQSADYLWCALRNKIPVQGHIWNYVRWKAPTFPRLVYQNTANPRLSTRAIETDYPTFVKAIRQYELDPAPYAATLKRLKAAQYRHGEMQTSPFFRRMILEKSPAMLKRVATELYHTAKRMQSYDFDQAERVVDRSCEFMCDYTDLCGVELWRGEQVRPKESIMRNFNLGDPLEYYNDEDSEREKRGA
jgi:hypothetical protein